MSHRHTSGSLLFPRFPRLPQRLQQGEERRRDEAAGKTVVVQVHPGVQEAEVAHQEHVQRACRDPGQEAVAPGDGRQGRAKQGRRQGEGALTGWMSKRLTRKTPIITGITFLRCLPNAPKPTTVRMPPAC